jgi:hypothetical protein
MPHSPPPESQRLTSTRVALSAMASRHACTQVRHDTAGTSRPALYPRPHAFRGRAPFPLPPSTPMPLQEPPRIVPGSNRARFESCQVRIVPGSNPHPAPHLPGFRQRARKDARQDVLQPRPGGGGAVPAPEGAAQAAGQHASLHQARCAVQRRQVARGSVPAARGGERGRGGRQEIKEHIGVYILISKEHIGLYILISNKHIGRLDLSMSGWACQLRGRGAGPRVRKQVSGATI